MFSFLDRVLFVLGQHALSSKSTSGWATHGVEDNKLFPKFGRIWKKLLGRYIHFNKLNSILLTKQHLLQPSLFYILLWDHGVKPHRQFSCLCSISSDILASPDASGESKVSSLFQYFTKVLESRMKRVPHRLDSHFRGWHTWIDWCFF